MVGTIQLTVARWARAASAKPETENPRCRITVPPRTSVGSTMEPAPCEMGAGHRKRISAGKSIRARAIRVFVTSARLDSITPLGRPVVPPV